MALVKLQTAMNEKFTDLKLTTCAEVVDFINKYIDDEKQEYLQNKKDRKVTWGKHKGLTIEEIAASQQGRDYLQWTLSQSWCDDKFSWFIDDCQLIGIKKKTKN